MEPCINGQVGAVGAYFGQDVQGIVDRLLAEQLPDGGWNCEAASGSTWSSFNTTICVLEALLEHERAVGASPEVTEARLLGQEYLLQRRMFRRLSTGEVINDRKGDHTRGEDIDALMRSLRSQGSRIRCHISGRLHVMNSKQPGCESRRRRITP